MREVKSIYQLLKAMNVNVTIPIEGKVDNVGAIIFLTQNRNASDRTKHVDVR